MSPNQLLFVRILEHHGGTYIAQWASVASARQAVVRKLVKGEAPMKVKEVMTPNVKAIWLTESLADAAKLMWENDCGVLPIIKDGRKVIGMITDRDICMALAMRDTNPSGVSVEEVMSGQVYAINPEDDVDQALQTMQDHRIRRLPVLNSEGELEGMLSMNDIVLNAKRFDVAVSDSIDYDDVVETYQAICQHPIPAAASSAAST
jgi:CBS domain-containing protein